MREGNENTLMMEEGNNNKTVKTFVGCEEKRQLNSLGKWPPFDPQVYSGPMSIKKAQLIVRLSTLILIY